MKQYLMSAAALGLVLGVPSIASANEGWYLSGGVGYGAPGDADVSGSLGNGANGGRISGESNWRERLALGYEFGTGWRIEGEFAHRYNNTGAIGNYEDSYSKFHAWSGMVNVLYDFNSGAAWRPYLGAGLGWVQSNASLAGWQNGTRPVGSIIPGDPRFIEVSDSDTALGYQLIAGIGWALSQNLTLDTEYRYFGYSSTSYTPGANVDALRGHEAWIGLRYLFAAPPPPPPPSCEDAEFVVYFEWDRSNVTDQSRNVINSAINSARNCGVAAVRVDGHADRSGSAAYNVGLSERRARAVRDELVRLGVPAGAVSINAYGESRPAVATPDGVREPLNRRVEVLINLN